MGSSIDLNIHMALGCRYAHTTIQLLGKRLLAANCDKNLHRNSDMILDLLYSVQRLIHMTSFSLHRSELIVVLNQIYERRETEKSTRVGRHDDRNGAAEGRLPERAAASEKQLFPFDQRSS